MVLNKFCFFLIFIFVILATGCNDRDHINTEEVDREPLLFPDYSGVTIPPNIAPMNLSVLEDGKYFEIEINTSNGNNIHLTSKDGNFSFPEKSWRKLLEDCIGNEISIQVYSFCNQQNILKKYQPVLMFVANEKIDPYIVYRSIYPGYYSWSEMKIMQRALESFNERLIVDNQLLDDNCVNCHTFNQYDPEKFLIHVRGALGGTYFADKHEISKTDLKTEDMVAGATYPAWHPDGRFVAFSSNVVQQSFYAQPGKDIEVYDLESSLVVYDTKMNHLRQVFEIDSSSEYNQTFPSWSPDGKYLYYSRTGAVAEPITADNIKHIKYDIVRNYFDANAQAFGATEVVVDAAGIDKSASFPKISPDGRYLLFTLHDYGTFPVWNKEADIHLLDLETGSQIKLEINSNDTESYHNWSSNGSWIVFSSKRKDGRTSLPYFANFIAPDSVGKPFVMPQQDPQLYNRSLNTFNLPEFVKGRIEFGPRDFERVAGSDLLKALPGDLLEMPVNKR